MEKYYNELHTKVRAKKEALIYTSTLTLIGLLVIAGYFLGWLTLLIIPIYGIVQYLLFQIFKRKGYANNDKG